MEGEPYEEEEEDYEDYPYEYYYFYYDEDGNAVLDREARCMKRRRKL